MSGRDARRLEDAAPALARERPGPRPAEIDVGPIVGNAAAAAVGRAAAARVAAAGTTGRELTKSETRDLGPRFGRDLSHVRVHEGEAARSAAMLLTARAFTVGSHVYLGCAPTVALLAHEVAHALQQEAAVPAAELAVEPAGGAQEAAAHAAATGAAPLLSPSGAAVALALDPDKERLRELMKDPAVAKRVERALAKGRDVSGVLNEELANVELRRRLSSGEGAADLLPKGVDPKSVTFVAGDEIWTTGGQPYTDGLLLDKAQLEKAIAAADAEAAKATGKQKGRPTAPPELTVDAPGYLEAKAGLTGAKKLTSKGEDVTKMTPEEAVAARKEFAKVKAETAAETPAGTKPGKVIKTDIGGQFAEVLERATIEGNSIDLVVKGRVIRVRFSRRSVGLAGVPRDVDISAGLEKARDPKGLGLDVRKVELPTTQKALKETAKELQSELAAKTPPGAVTKAAPVPEPAKEPAKTPETAVKTPPAEAKPEVVPEAKPEAKPDAKAVPLPDAKPAPKPEIKPEPKPEVKPEAKSEVKAEPLPEAKPEPKPEAKPEPKLEAKPAGAVPKPVEGKTPIVTNRPQTATAEASAPALETTPEATPEAKPAQPVKKTIGAGGVRKQPYSGGWPKDAPAKKPLGRPPAKEAPRVPVATESAPFVMERVVDVTGQEGGRLENAPLTVRGRVRVGGGPGGAGAVGGGGKAPESLAPMGEPLPGRRPPPVEKTIGRPAPESLVPPMRLNLGPRPSVPIAEPPGSGLRGAGEGAGMIIHGAQEQIIVGNEHKKEAAAFEKLRPILERELAEGRWVVVHTHWMRTRDPIGDLAGYHELGTLPTFEFLTWRSGKTPEDARNPPDTGPTISALPPGTPMGPSREFIEREATLRKDRTKYMDEREYTLLRPDSAIPRTKDPLVRRPSLRYLEGRYTAVGAPHELLLTERGDTFEVTAWDAKTQVTYDVLEQSWRWYGDELGVLTCVLADSATGTRIESTIAVWGLGGPTIREHYTVARPGESERTANVVRERLP
jgi:hypothetical protein